jgi:hypothetical protein
LQGPPKLGFLVWKYTIWQPWCGCLYTKNVKKNVCFILPLLPKEFFRPGIDVMVAVFCDFCPKPMLWFFLQKQQFEFFLQKLAVSSNVYIPRYIHIKWKIKKCLCVEWMVDTSPCDPFANCHSKWKK